MKPGLSLLSVLCLAALAARAEFPVEDMDGSSLGLQYGMTFRGQDITEAAVPSHETIHMISLAYAPVSYVSLEAGVGVDRFSVDAHEQVRFRGDYGISPSFGVSLFSPAVLDIIRLSLGAKVLYLDSEDDDGFRYSGFVSNPYLGLLASPSVFLDLAVGGRMHMIEGSMRQPRSDQDSPFSNKRTFRGYASVTLKTPYEKAFLTLDLEMSRGFETDWVNGPREAAVGISFGTILGWKPRNAPAGDKSTYFPAYPEMKEKQRKMAEEL